LPDGKGEVDGGYLLCLGHDPRPDGSPETGLAALDFVHARIDAREHVIATVVGNTRARNARVEVTSPHFRTGNDGTGLVADLPADLPNRSYLCASGWAEANDDHERREKEGLPTNQRLSRSEMLAQM